jgi:ATP-dependent Lon protease
MFRKIAYLLIAMIASNNCFAAGHELPAYLTVMSAEKQAEMIDDALLMSYFTALGVETNMYQQFKEISDIEYLMACAHPNVITLVRQHYSSQLKNALSKDELKSGAKLASSKAFIKANSYIKLNFQSLAKQAAASKSDSDFSKFLLLTAADRLKLSNKERQEIIDFLEWHTRVSPELNRESAAMQDKFILSIAKIISSCKRPKR